MGPATLVFWIASIVALAGGLGVVLFKEPIRNVLSLVVVMLSLAVLFLLLSAQFVFVVQVIVYAGAVMVLFLFVITLLGPVREQTTMRLPWQVFISAVVIAAFAGFLVAMLRGVTYRTFTDFSLGVRYLQLLATDLDGAGVQVTHWSRPRGPRDR